MLDDFCGTASNGGICGVGEMARDTITSGDGGSSHESFKPIIVTVGGNHSISLSILRALKEVHKSPVSVLHFDAHMDRWAPDTDAYWDTEQSHFNHGSVI